jgi:hypothetical protein
MSGMYDARKRLETYLISFLICIAVLYGIYRAYPLLTGPSIVVTSPYDGEIVGSSTFEVTGTVKRATVITVQGRPITIDTKGAFTETLVASLPYTILVLTATDSYGKTVTKTIRVIPK